MYTTVPSTAPHTEHSVLASLRFLSPEIMSCPLYVECNLPSQRFFFFLSFVVQLYGVVYCVLLVRYSSIISYYSSGFSV